MAKDDNRNTTTTIRLLNDIDDCAKDITRLLVQLPVPDDAQSQARDITLNDFDIWRNLRLKRLRKVYEKAAENHTEATNNKPTTEQSR